MQNYSNIAVLITLILFSCSSEDNIRTYRLPKKSNEVVALVEEKKVSSKITGKTKNFTLKWETPEGWEQFDGHPMRMASFYVPHTVGKGELSITEFSGMSGGIQANINRWRGQVSLPPQSEQSIIDASITYNSELGKFLFLSSFIIQKTFLLLTMLGEPSFKIIFFIFICKWVETSNRGSFFYFFQYVIFIYCHKLNFF